MEEGGRARRTRRLARLLRDRLLPRHAGTCMCSACFSALYCVINNNNNNVMYTHSPRLLLHAHLITTILTLHIQAHTAHAPLAAAAVVRHTASRLPLRLAFRVPLPNPEEKDLPSEIEPPHAISAKLSAALLEVPGAECRPAWRCARDRPLYAPLRDAPGGSGRLESRRGI